MDKARKGERMMEWVEKLARQLASAESDIEWTKVCMQGDAWYWMEQARQIIATTSEVIRMDLAEKGVTLYAKSFWDKYTKE